MKSKNTDWNLLRTKICEEASIGAVSIFLPGLTIGKKAVVGARSVVTKNVPDGDVGVGNLAKFVRLKK